MALAVASGRAPSATTMQIMPPRPTWARTRWTRLPCHRLSQSTRRRKGVSSRTVKTSRTATNWKMASSSLLAHLMSTSEKMASRLPVTSRKMALLTVLPCMVGGLWESGFQEVGPDVRAGKGFIAALFFVGGSAAVLAVQPHVKPYRIEFGLCLQPVIQRDRKSTRLNSSHVAISYAVFCLKKKNKHNTALWSH